MTMLPDPSAVVVPETGGVRLTVRLTPKASRNAVQGVAAAADGTAVVKVAVTAVPEGGKANAALIKLLAKEWKLPKSSMEIVAGTTDRRKTLRIEGDAADLAARIAARLASPG